MYASCTYQHSDKLDFLFEIRLIFNKKLWMQYNSTRGNWTGFTEDAISLSGHYNGDPDDGKLRKIEEMIICTDNKELTEFSKNLTEAPTVKLTSVKQSSGTEPALLLCSAYNFYPKEIKTTWLQNGQEVTSGVSFTEVLSTGDWYYLVHSYLEYSPKPGEEITCMVEHTSLREPLLQVWDRSLLWSERLKIATGTFVLVLGVVVLVIGFLHNKKKNCCSLHTEPRT